MKNLFRITTVLVVLSMLLIMTVMICCFNKSTEDIIKSNYKTFDSEGEVQHFYELDLQRQGVPYRAIVVLIKYPKHLSPIEVKGFVIRSLPDNITVEQSGYKNTDVDTPFDNGFNYMEVYIYY